MACTTNNNADIPIEILNEETVFCGQWLDTKRLTIAKRENKRKQELWEIVRRKKLSESAKIHGVYIIPIIKHRNGDRFVILIKQFRLPLMSYALEFPGGFVNKNDSPETTAVRELWEETGYTGTVHKVSAGICTEAASCLYSLHKFVTVHIDGDDPLNRDPKQNIPDDELESIEVVKIPLKELCTELQKLADGGLYIMGNVFAFANGLETAKNLL